MKKQISCICAAAAIAVCGASCGSSPASKSGVKASVETLNNVTNEECISMTVGNWETVREYLNGTQLKKDDITYNRYILAEDGSGLYYDSDGNEQQVSWEVTPDGGVQILYEEMGEFTEYYDFLGCDLAIQKETEDGPHDIYLAKVSKFSEKGDTQ